jgi:hypothetical protein
MTTSRYGNMNGLLFHILGLDLDRNKRKEQDDSLPMTTSRGCCCSVNSLLFDILGLDLDRNKRKDHDASPTYDYQPLLLQYERPPVLHPRP